MTTGIHLSPSGNDRLMQILMRKGISRRLTLMTATLFVAAAPYLWIALTDAVRNPSLSIDAAHDYGYFNQFFLFLPFMVWFIPYYFGGFEAAILTLRNRRVLSLSDSELAQFTRKANTIFCNPVVTWLPYMLSSSATVIGFYSFWGAHKNTWNSPLQEPLAEPAVWLSMPPTFLLYLLVGQCLLRMGCIRTVITLLFNDEKRLVISAFHPDGAGGLSPLGDFSMRVTPACLLGGLVTLVGVLTNTYQYGRPLFDSLNLLYVLAYMTALIVAFFVPLLAARGGMSRAKTASLELISDRCTHIMREAVDDLRRKGDTEASKLKSLENLTKLYEMSNRMPIYPFNTRNVVRFGSSVLWPLALMILKWVQEQLTKP